MGEALVQGVACRLDDVARGIEIGLPDLEMDDVAALCLQRARFHQHFEGGLGAETRHAFGEAKFERLESCHVKCYRRLALTNLQSGTNPSTRSARA